MRERAVGHRDGLTERAGEIAEPSSQDNCNRRRLRHARSHGVGGFFDLIVVVHISDQPQGSKTRKRIVFSARDASCLRGYNMKPAIVAVMKFASVPANIARSPSRARS